MKKAKFTRAYSSDNIDKEIMDLRDMGPEYDTVVSYLLQYADEQGFRIISDLYRKRLERILWENREAITAKKTEKGVDNTYKHMIPYLQSFLKTYGITIDEF